MTKVLGFIAPVLLVVLTMSCERKPRDPFEGNACINRIRMIDGAKDQWALDQHKTTNDVPTWEDIRYYLSREGDIPTCPAGGAYTVGHVGEGTKCSYHQDD